MYRVNHPYLETVILLDKPASGGEECTRLLVFAIQRRLQHCSLAEQHSDCKHLLPSEGAQREYHTAAWPSAHQQALCFPVSAAKQHSRLNSLQSTKAQQHISRAGLHPSMEARALRLFWALAAAALCLTSAPRPSSAGTCRQVQPEADTFATGQGALAVCPTPSMAPFCWRRDTMLLHVQGPGSATRFCALPERLGNFQGALGGKPPCGLLYILCMLCQGLRLLGL